MNIGVSICLFASGNIAIFKDGKNPSFFIFIRILIGYLSYISIYKTLRKELFMKTKIDKGLRYLAEDLLFFLGIIQSRRILSFHKNL